MKKLLCMLLSLALLLTLGSAMAEAKIKSIEVTKLPDKTVYVIGEEFSAEGGILTVTYDDGTTEEIALTDSEVKLSKPTMNTANTKTVNVKYGKGKTSFKVEVTAGMCTVSFYPGFAGGEILTQEVGKGATASEIAAPARDGYDFIGWYADEDYTRLYDFASPVAGDTGIYALWLESGAEAVQVTFDYDYYGTLLASYSYPVAAGNTVKAPVNAPERVGYTFDRWLDENGNDFDFSAPVTADVTVKAAWNKTVTEAQTWVFEAEDTDLSGKIGPSFSGTAQEESMIVFNDAIDASNNRVVGYLYENGVSLEFYVASDIDVDNATLVVRVTGEYTTMSYDGNDFQVLVNGEAKSYPRVTMEVADTSTVLKCQDAISIAGVALKAGENLIQLKTNNTNAVTGTTFKANAPMVDCVKITSDAVLIWDENHGEPAVKNYAK